MTEEKKKVEKFWENVSLTVDIICSVIFFVSFVYNLFKGIVAHDAYYLVMSIILFIFINFKFEKIRIRLQLHSLHHNKMHLALQIVL